MDNRECVSYAAWKVQSTFHDMPDWTSANLPPDARYWPTLAYQDNIPTGTTPKVHSVAIAQPGQPLETGWMAGPTGHAMWVEGVSPDGQSVEVSQYNEHDDGNYSQTTVPAHGLMYIYFGERRL